MRERCAEILAAGEAHGLAHFAVAMERLPAVAERVARLTRERFPDLRVPLHSRWRHFSTGGVDRWAPLAQRLGGEDPGERARARIDLAVIGVLLDAGAGDRWRYREPGTGLELARSEGLAAASLHLFASGALSTHPGRPLRVDAAGLLALELPTLARAFQVGPDNPLAGLEGRLALLHGLGRTMMAAPGHFGSPPRVGHLYDCLAETAGPEGITAASLLGTLLAALGPAWPGRLRLAGVSLGDTWRHPAVRRADPTDALVPLHKLSQWLAYSLVEPLVEAGMAVRDLDGLTGLAEYRNGGLLVDEGVLAPKDPALAERPLEAGHEAVVEWRALTVALLDRLAPLVRDHLRVDARALPLGAILEGGTWAAGRALARDRRPGGGPPIAVISDGTVF